MAIEPDGTGSRHIDKYLGENLYIICLDGEDTQAPHDIIASVSSATLNLDQNTLANIDALAGMVSLALREYDLDYVVGKLLESSRGPNTLPCILANSIIDHWGVENAKTV